MLVESTYAEQFAYLEQYTKKATARRRGSGSYTMVKVQDGLVMMFDYGDDATCEGEYASWVKNLPLDVCVLYEIYEDAEFDRLFAERMTLRTDEFVKWTFSHDANCSNFSTTRYHPLGYCFSLSTSTTQLTRVAARY